MNKEKRRGRKGNIVATKTKTKTVKTNIKCFKCYHLDHTLNYQRKMYRVV